MTLTLIAAMSKNNIIGKDGSMPWGRIKEDLQHFKEITLNHPVLMGRKTYESIGRLLPNRENIILSSKDLQIPGAHIYNSLEKAISFIRDEQAYIIGGQTLYEQTINLPETNKLEITYISGKFDGDTFFPKIDMDKWKIEKESKGEQCEFVTYIRK